MVTEVRTCTQIASLSDLHTRFGLAEADAADFFPEWQRDLPALSDEQMQAIAAYKQRYDYHRPEGKLLAGTVALVVLAPLLELVGFLDPPFQLRSTYGVILDRPHRVKPMRGFVSSCIVQEQLWCFAIETANNSIPLAVALPELLMQMLTAPVLERDSYALLTNGDEFAFLKLRSLNLAEHQPAYALSRTFSLFPDRHELPAVVQILQHLGRAIRQRPAL